MRYKKAFTLIEMMIAISILSIMMLFLYRSNASVNKSNTFYKREVNKLTSLELKKKILFLDFSLMLNKSNMIINQDKKTDLIFFQTTHSLHRRVNPFIAYIVKNKKLYRLESLKKLKYPLDVESKFDIDYLGLVDIFRVYKQKDTFLIHIKFKNRDEILFKVVSLNGQ